MPLPALLSRLFRNRADAPPMRRTFPAGAFRNAVALPGAAQGEALPEWVRIVPIGAFPMHHDGPHAITAEDLAAMAQNFERHATDLLIDVDHASIWGETRAAGWSSAVEVRDDGLYMRYPEWTPRGEELTASREYRYLSPVYQLDARDKTGGPIGARLLSVALTNAPYFNEGEIDPIVNADPAGDITPTPTPMNETTRKALIARYALADDATDEQINAAVAADAALATPPETEPDTAVNSGTPVPPPVPPPPATAPTVESLQQQLDAMRAERETGAVEALVNSAVTRGKILPADRDLCVNAARADFAATKAALDARADGSALPSRVKANSARPARTGLAGSVPTAAMDYVNKQFGVA